MRLSLIPLLGLTLLAGTAALPGSGGAAITFYDDQAAFIAASSATLQTTFDSYSPGPVPNFSAGVLSFIAGGGGLYILQPGSMDSFPLNATPALTENGDEDIRIQFTTGLGLAIGFDAVTNRYDMPQVQVLDENDAVLASFPAGIAPTTAGFVGIVSTVPFKTVRWTSDRGRLMDTYLDNVRAKAAGVTPAARATWGRIKQLYR